MLDELTEFVEAASEPEKETLLIIGHTGEIKSTKLQKISLIVKAAMDGKVPTTHGAYLFGGYSDDVEEAAEGMRSEGFLAYESGKGFSLTQDGKDIFELLSKKEPKMNETVRQVIEMLRGLSDKQITAITYKLFPEFTKNSIIKDEMKKIGENINIETFKLHNHR